MYPIEIINYSLFQDESDEEISDDEYNIDNPVEVNFDNANSIIIDEEIFSDKYIIKIPTEINYVNANTVIIDGEIIENANIITVDDEIIEEIIRRINLRKESTQQDHTESFEGMQQNFTYRLFNIYFSK
jgi:hypothetical protein